MHDEKLTTTLVHAICDLQYLLRHTVDCGTIYPPQYKRMLDRADKLIEVLDSSTHYVSVMEVESGDE